MFKKSRYTYQRRSLFATVILMVMISVFSAVYVWNIKHITEQQCYTELADSTHKAIDEIESQLRADRTMLRMIAHVIEDSGESLHSLDVSRYLNIYDVNSLISQVGILLPDNTVIPVSGQELDASGILDFDRINAIGEHIGGLEPSLDNPEDAVIRSYVPIRKDGKTVAYLYSAMEPVNILSAWVPDIYDGQAGITVVERATGDYLIDSSDKAGDGEVNARQHLGDKVLRGGSSEEVIENITTGHSGYALFRDGASGDELYMCYMPMDIEPWEMVVTVSSATVFASVSPIRAHLYIFLLVEGALLVVYFLYLLRITSVSIEGVERRANVDALTGLQNRNRYEYFCDKLQQGTDGLACIYVDANGLHELNNTKGHLAGDNMLKTVANILKKEYGEDNTYRIGGDEFVAFRYDREEESIREDMVRVGNAVELSGYHVAMGMAVATPEHKLADVIKKAETEMYENKARYYELTGRKMRK